MLLLMHGLVYDVHLILLKNFFFIDLLGDGNFYSPWTSIMRHKVRDSRVTKDERRDSLGDITMQNAHQNYLRIWCMFINAWESKIFVLSTG